jgi:CHASE1-domain containing sensor protein
MAYELVANGYISSLEPTIEEINKSRANKDEPILYSNLEDAMHNIDALFIEYVYLWNGRSWEVSFASSFKLPKNSYGDRNYHYYHTEFKPLEDCITEEVA